MSLFTLTSAIAGSGCEAINKEIFDSSHDLQYFNGMVISNAKVHVIFWGDQVASYVTDGIGDFLKAFLNSSLLDLLTEYDTDYVGGTRQHIGRGTFTGSTAIQPVNTAGSLEDQDITAEIENQIYHKILPNPDSDTLYMIYLPAAIHVRHGSEGSSCNEWCGYHAMKDSSTFGKILYAVSTDLNSSECRGHCNPTGRDFDSITMFTSHEIAEAITDAEPRTTVDLQSWNHQAWVSFSGDESGDYCNRKSTSLQVQGGKSYVIQQIWDNAIHGCNPGPFEGTLN